MSPPAALENQKPAAPESLPDDTALTFGVDDGAEPEVVDEPLPDLPDVPIEIDLPDPDPEPGFAPPNQPERPGLPPLSLETARDEIGSEVLSKLEEKFKGRLSGVRRLDARDHLF